MVANIVWLHTSLKFFLRFLSNFRNAKCRIRPSHAAIFSMAKCLSATEGRRSVPESANFQWRTRQDHSRSKMRIAKMIMRWMSGPRSRLSKRHIRFGEDLIQNRFANEIANLQRTMQDRIDLLQDQLRFELLQSEHEDDDMASSFQMKSTPTPVLGTTQQQFCRNLLALWDNGELTLQAWSQKLTCFDAAAAYW